jgi:Secretion system C-terminal sorting domain
VVVPTAVGTTDHNQNEVENLKSTPVFLMEKGAATYRGSIYCAIGVIYLLISPFAQTIYMRRIFTLTIACLFCTLSSQAVLKTWIGASGGTWSTGSNWNPAGVPGSLDDVEFTGATLVVVDINPSVNSLLISAGGIVEFSASATRTLLLSSTSTTTPGLKINAGATLKIAPTAAVAFRISLTNSAGVTGDIYGTLLLAGTVANATPNLEIFQGALSFGNVKVYDGGIVQYDVNSGNTAGFGVNNFQMEAGSQYIVLRNGGVVPNGNFKNGSIIRIKGVTSSATSLNSSATFAGLIEWDCPSQAATVSGSAANILPSASITIDSLRIVNTGLGTTRLTTNPNGFNIGHLEVQGGTLELSAPGSSGRNGTITTDFKITGGTAIGNATFTFDNIAPDSMRLVVNGSFVMSGGSFNLSNRPPALPSGGSFGMLVKGDVTQSGGTISCSSDFSGLSPSRINYIEMAGTAAQNVTLNAWSGPIQFIANNTNGINLLSAVTCPDTLYLKSGYLQLNNNHVQCAAGKFKTQAVLPTPRMVTNGTGHLTLTGLNSFATATFPVTPTINSISSVILKNNDLSANTFNVRVERGNNPTGIYNTGLTVNRTWIINDATNIGANQVELTFIYPDTAINVLCNRSGVMELGHFPVSAWSVDPVGITRTPLLGAVNTNDTTGVFAPNSLDSAFVLGNEFSILTLNAGITLNYFKGNKQANSNALNWSVNCTSNQATFDIQRSNNGISFATIGNIIASYTRCLQPFDFADNNPQGGLSYYRIKITDVDGRITYSTMVLLQSKDFVAGTMALLPTLVNKPLAILYIDAAKAGQVQVNITDANGRMIRSGKETVIAGQNQLTLNFEQLNPGVYYISAYGNNQKWATVRFVKL